jgi:hypothetical protein
LPSGEERAHGVINLAPQADGQHRALTRALPSATRTIREIPTEIRPGGAEGLAVECAASFGNLQRIRRSALTDRVGDLGSCSRSAEH